MELTSQYFLLIVLFLFGLYFLLENARKTKKLPKNFPPGPRSYIPLLGGMVQCGREPHILFLKLRKKWGDIFAFDMGPKRVVTINNYKIMKEALAKAEFNGRSDNRAFLLKMANEEPHGVLLNQGGQAQSDQRKFAVKNLHDFGFGTRQMEQLIEIEANELVEIFRKFKGQSILVKNEFNMAAAGSLLSIVAGKRYGQTDPGFTELFKKMTEDFEMVMVLFFYPWLFKVAEWWPSFLMGKVQRYIDNSKWALDFMKKEIDQHRETYNENSERDFIDKYLTKIKNEQDPKSSFYQKEGDLNLTTVVHDVFLAGTETISSTLNWCIHLLSIHPQIQEKVFKEIENVVGLSRTTSLLDRNSLPYTEATINEVLRFAAIIPVIPHNTTMDIKNFHGFDIPEGTLVFFNLYACLHDPDYWTKPEEFNPDRFLSEDGQKIVKHEAFFPFFSGKRTCIGESLARDTAFLFISTLLQKFKIIPDPSRKTPEKIQSIVGAANMPISFPLVFQDRNDSDFCN